MLDSWEAGGFGELAAVRGAGRGELSGRPIVTEKNIMIVERNIKCGSGHS